MSADAAPAGFAEDALEIALAADVERRRVRHGIAVLVGSSLLFSVMAVCVRIAGREMPALQIAFVRFTGSLVVLLALARGKRLRPRPGNLVRVVLRGVLGASAILCYFVAIQRIGAGRATLLHCMYPIPTALIAVVFLGEPGSWRLVGALALNLAGLALVVGPQARAGGAAAGGFAIALVGAMLAGGAVATARHLRASEGASLITIYFMAVGALLTAPALLLGTAVPSGVGVAALVGVVLTSAGGQWMMHHGLGFTPASLGSLTCATGVFTAAGLETLLLGERMSATFAGGTASLVGAVLMCLAVGLAARRG
ncbi:MAG: DMT family transporter [Deltaproteobacteria bacterium]|nr:DMT family transporter [Deltaproteobacteria bacterium]